MSDYRSSELLIRSGISESTGLLDHDIDFIAILHFEAIGRVIILNSLSVEDEAALVIGEALPLAVGVHQLLQLRGPLDLEVNLGTILGLHLDVDVLLFLACFSSGGGGSILVSFGVSHLSAVSLVFCTYHNEFIKVF